MRTLLFIIVVFLSCKQDPNLSFFAIKESEIYKFKNSITVNEFIRKAESLKCDGYNILARATENVELSNNEFIIKTNCKFPKQLKFIHPDGIQLPIYKCNSVRNYGIDLCEDDKSNFKLIKEFYLNPRRQADYPSNPKNATVKFIVDESSTLKSITPMIKQVKSMRDKIGGEKLRKLPFLLSIQTIKKDSIQIKPTKTVN